MPRRNHGRTHELRGVALIAALLLSAPGLLLSAPALGQDLLDDDDDLLGGDDDATERQERLQGGDAIDLLDDPSDIDAIAPSNDLEPGDDLLGDDLEPVSRAADTAEIYRATQEEVEELDADEELMVWEQYLADYPGTAFADRIGRRIDQLTSEMYGQTIGARQVVDADEEEIPFSQGLLIENLNPRTRLQAGFEWGLPDYMNLVGDYEHRLQRDLSVHVGLRRRFTGWSLEGGARYALVKSVRTQTIVSFIGDVHMNLDPAFIGVRPLIAAGRRFNEKLDVQVQLGPDIELRAHPAVRLAGGANVTYRAAQNVALFGETSVNMKNFFWADGGTFRFNILSFGMKFYPDLDAPGEMEINFGASVPYTSNYWMYHYGSIMGQVNYYL